MKKFLFLLSSACCILSCAARISVHDPHVWVKQDIPDQFFDMALIMPVDIQFRQNQVHAFDVSRTVAAQLADLRLFKLILIGESPPPGTVNACLIRYTIERFVTAPLSGSQVNLSVSVDHYPSGEQIARFHFSAVGKAGDGYTLPDEFAPCPREILLELIEESAGYIDYYLGRKK